MARILTDISFFVKGNPNESNCYSAFVYYNVTSGDAVKKNNIFNINNADLNKLLFNDNSPGELIRDVIDQIKINEGIE